MKKHHTIIIAGAGGIAQAVGLILAEWSQVKPTLFIGNRTLSKAQEVAKWIEEGISQSCVLKSFHLSEESTTSEMKEIFHQRRYYSRLFTWNASTQNSPLCQGI